MIITRLPELVIMTASQLKKDFRSKNIYDICSAIHFASSICTKELSFCIEDDLQRLLTYSKPCVRKRGCVFGRKLILSNGELGDKVSKLLIEKLKDDDTGVLIAAISSILDCSIQYPKFFIEAIPSIYKLVEHKNNWLVIKAIQVVFYIISNLPLVMLLT